MDPWLRKHALVARSQAGIEAALLGLAEAIDLGAQVRASATTLVEVAAEGGRKERSEDDLSTATECQKVSQLCKEQYTYWKGGRANHRRKTNLKTK